MSGDRKVSLKALAEAERKIGATVEFAGGKRYVVLNIDEKRSIAHLRLETK